MAPHPKRTTVVWRSVFGSTFRYVMCALLFGLLTFNTANAENRHGIAVIIGNSAYSNGDVPDVAYAHRDADAFREYVVDVLEYREENIIDLRDASQTEMIATFGVRGNHEGRIWQYYRGGRSDIVVFYSGHGVPGRNDLSGYLLPSDADPLTAELNGYPIDVLYENLAALEARSVTVFLDACFSGASHAGMLIQSASPVFVSAELPETSSEGFTVLTAASGDQLASWDEDQRYGLFTGYLLDGLYGAADAEEFGNGDGQVSVSEVKAWLDEEMTYAARRNYRRHQEATVLGDPDRVLSRVPAVGWGETGTSGVASEDQLIAETQTAALPPEPASTPAAVPEPEPPFTVHGTDEVLFVQTRANIRSGPGTEYNPPIGQLEAGDEIRVTGRVEDLNWARIALASGEEAYVYAPLLGEELPEQVAVGAYLTPGTVFRDCSDCPEMVVVPAGTFMMGSPPEEEGRHGYEGPRYEVQISQPIAVGVYEATFDEWEACVAAGGCNGYIPEGLGAGLSGHAATYVSWDDAQAYLEWLSSTTGESYRLLSEVEWEYVARAGTQTRYWWGEEFSTNQVYIFQSGTGQFQPVGVYNANAFGLYDVHGNVWELTQDCWNAGYSGAPASGVPWTSGDCTRRVIRGGALFNEPRDLRSATRGANSESERNIDVGFRVARNIRPEELGERTNIALEAPSAPEQVAVGTHFSPGTVFQDCSVCPEMVIVPAGTFTMGTPEHEEGRNESEGPAHHVTIRKPLAVGVFEVTVGEFTEFASRTGLNASDYCVAPRYEGANSATPIDGLSWQNPGFLQTSRYPVTCVSWENAKAYVGWLSDFTGERYRLLSESEWEYVARAGTSTRFWWGDQYDTSRAADGTSTEPVGSYSANSFGLFDVVGNVMEWTEDCWNGSHIGATNDGSARTAGDCSYRVTRGGSWFTGQFNRNLRSGFRWFWIAVENWSSFVGFRVAREIQ